MTSQIRLGSFALMATLTWLAPVAAQSIYKCGNTYGETPCAGGVVIDANDSRTAAQKAQSDRQTKEARQTAANMEKDRLETEKALSGPPHGKGATAKPPATKEARAKMSKAGLSRKKAAPEYFTAAVLPDDPKPKASRKKSGTATTPAADEKP